MKSNQIWDWVPFTYGIIEGEIEFMFETLSKPVEY